MSRMSENVGTSTSRNPKGLHGLYRENFTYLYLTTPWRYIEECRYSSTILDLATRWGKGPATNWTEVWVGIRLGLDTKQKSAQWVLQLMTFHRKTLTQFCLYSNSQAQLWSYKCNHISYCNRPLSPSWLQSKCHIGRFSFTPYQMWTFVTSLLLSKFVSSPFRTQASYSIP
jgi:hypothetical protein